MTSYEKAVVLAHVLDSRKAADVKVLKTEALTTLADYFVIGSATSNTQIKAIAGACEEMMDKLQEPPHHIEGHRDGTWLLMDYSSVVVHVFTDESRKFYDLERLWGDAEEMDVAKEITEDWILWERRLGLTKEA